MQFDCSWIVLILVCIFFLTQFQIQNCLKTLGWVILQCQQIQHLMQGPFKLLFEEKKIAFEKKLHHWWQWRPHEKSLTFKISSSKCQDGTMYSRSNILKDSPPRGPKIDFLILKSYSGTTWTRGIISITMGPFWACTLFWFPYIMAGYCFQYVNDVFFLQEYGLWSHLSEWVWFKYLFEGGRGGWILKCNFHS